MILETISNLLVTYSICICVSPTAGGPGELS